MFNNKLALYCFLCKHYFCLFEECYNLNSYVRRDVCEDEISYTPLSHNRIFLDLPFLTLRVVKADAGIDSNSVTQAELSLKYEFTSKCSQTKLKCSFFIMGLP